MISSSMHVSFITAHCVTEYHFSSLCWFF